MKAFAEDCRFLFYTLFHPFDGFYELRFRRRKNWLLIASLLVLYALAEIFRQQYTGMIMRTWDTYGLNGLLIFVSTLFPVVLFAVSNWSVTTLTEGNGITAQLLKDHGITVFTEEQLDALFTAEQINISE